MLGAGGYPLDGETGSYWSSGATSDYVLLSSPWPTLCILAGYLYFVLKAGPDLMENRKPFRLKQVLLVYNLLLVLASSWYVFKVHHLIWDRFFIGHCRANTLEPDLMKSVDYMACLYFISKFIELFDTVFFVLRKKMNQVSFLHVYHHANMVLMTWFFTKVMKGSQLMIITHSNTAVHILMYGYYFLAAFGPGIQKYLWWKKYLTTLQIVQFLLIMGFMSSLLVVPGCQVPKEMVILAICNTSSFFVLFLYFYSKTYRNDKKALKSKIKMP